jgi:hypothetical protein
LVSSTTFRDASSLKGSQGLSRALKGSQGHTGRFNAESYTAFLAHVLAQTREPLILDPPSRWRQVQDGAKYHTGQATQQFFATHAACLTVFQLPADSPDFNPIEVLWNKVKKQATHLRYFPDFATLVEKVDGALLHFAQTPREITAVVGRYGASLAELAA